MTTQCRIQCLDITRPPLRRPRKGSQGRQSRFPRASASWHLARLAVAAALLALGAASAAGQCHYTYVTIPNPPGWVAHATAINDVGQVVGNLDNAGDYSRAFVWSPGGATTQLPAPPGMLDSRANDVNNQGHVVGEMIITGSGRVAYLWDALDIQILPTRPGVTSAAAQAINELGQVTGHFIFPSTGFPHACVWNAGVFVDLGPQLGQDGSAATGINELGEIVGYSYPWHAFRWNGVVADWLSEPPGILQSLAGGLNNNGIVVGNFVLGEFPNQYSSGAVWMGDRAFVVEAIDGSTFAFLYEVNDAGRAVGDLREPANGPIVWQYGEVGNLRSLVIPDVPAGLRNATDINQSGQICAWTSTGSVVLQPHWMEGDLTGDCAVTIEDLLVLLTNFGRARGSYPRGDVDLDGDVDLSDLAALLSDWGY